MPIYTDSENDRLQADADRWRQTMQATRNNAAAALQAVERISSYRAIAPQLPAGAYASLAQAGVDPQSPQFQQIASTYIPTPESNTVKSPAETLLDRIEAQYGRNDKGMVRIGPLQKMYSEADVNSPDAALIKEAIALARANVGKSKPKANDWLGDSIDWVTNTDGSYERSVVGRTLTGLVRGVTSGGTYAVEATANVVGGGLGQLPAEADVTLPWSQKGLGRSATNSVEDAPWSKAGLANMLWRGTTAGQVLTHPNEQGSGYLPAQAYEGAEEAKKRTLGVDAGGGARTIGSHVIDGLNRATEDWVNIARPAGQPRQHWQIAAPGSGGYHLIKGGVDMAFAVKYDVAGNAAFDAFNKARTTAKTFDVVKEAQNAGAFRNAFTSWVDPRRYDDWEQTWAGQRVITQMTETKSPAVILDHIPQLKRTPGGVELAHALAEANDPMIVSELMRDAAGTSLRNVPKFGTLTRETGGLGYEFRRITQNNRWAAMVPGGHITWKDLGRGYVTLEDSLKNARLPDTIRRGLQDEYVAAAALPNEAMRRSAIHKVVSSAYDTIGRRLSGRGYWSGPKATEFVRGLIDSPATDIHTTVRDALTHSFPEIEVTDDLVRRISNHAVSQQPGNNKAIRDIIEEVTPFQRRKIDTTLADDWVKLVNRSEEELTSSRWWAMKDPDDIFPQPIQISQRDPDGVIRAVNLEGVAVPTHLLNDGIALPDYKLIRRASSRYTNLFTINGKDKLVSTMISGGGWEKAGEKLLDGINPDIFKGGQTRLALRVLEDVNSTWKLLKLFSPRMATQAVAEFNLAAAMGRVDTHFSHPMGMVARIIKGIDTIPETYDEVLEEVARGGASITKRAVKGLDESTSDLLTEASMDGYRTMGMPTNNPLARDSMIHDGFEFFDRATPAGIDAHAHNIVALHADPVARKVAQAMERDAFYQADPVASAAAGFNPNKAIDDYVADLIADGSPAGAHRELVGNATRHEREAWRENLLSPDLATREEAARFYVDTVQRQIREITSEQDDLLKAIANGSFDGERIVGGARLDKYSGSLKTRLKALHDEGTAPRKIRAPRLIEGPSKTAWVNRMSAGFDRMMRVLSDQPLEHLASRPVLYDAWHVEARRLLPGITDDELKAIYNASLDDATHAQATRSFATPVSPTGKITAAEVDALSRHVAMEKLRAMAYNASDKAQFTDLLGLLSPFANVMRHEATRAARLVSRDAPRIARRAQQLGEVGTQSHFIGRDSEGNVALHVPIPALANAAIGALPGMENPQLGSIDIPLNTLPNAMFNAMPGAGPIGSVLLGPLLRRFDEWADTDIENTVMPFGPPTMSKDGLFKLFAPGFVSELAKAASDETAKVNVDAQAYFMWYLHNQNPEKYPNTPAAAEQLNDDALELTRSFHGLNAWAKAWLPGQVKMPLKVKADSGVIEMTMVANKLRELQRQAYDDPNVDDPTGAAISQFINLFGAELLGGMHDRYGDKTDPAFQTAENPQGRADQYYATQSAQELYKSVQPKSVPMVYGLMPTTETAQFRKAHPGLVKDYPQIWALFAPPPSSGESDFYALGYQPMTNDERAELDTEYKRGERKSVTLAEGRKIGEIRLGQYAYDRYRNMFGVNPTDEQNAFLSEVRKEIGKEFPEWGNRDQQPNAIKSLIGGKIDHDAAVEKLAEAAKHPSIKDTPAAKGLEAYLSLRSIMLEKLGTRSSSSFGNKNAAEVRAFLRNAAEVVAADYPEFVNIYDKILEYETREPRT